MLIEEGGSGPYGRATVERIVDLLDAGRDVVAHSSTGPSDPRETKVDGSNYRIWGDVLTD